MRLLLLTLFLFSCGWASAQESSQELVDRIDDIMSNSETYENYKVIRTSSLKTFKYALRDSLIDSRSRIESLNSQTMLLQEKLEIQSEKLALLSESLEKSEVMNHQIGFLGLKLNKRSYHAFVWSFIALLGTVLTVLYLRIKHACNVVKRVKEAYSKILEEYRTQRFAATEKQMSLKRELQTALNKLDTLQKVE